MPDWNDDEESRTRVQTVLGHISQEQAYHPECRLCGQRAAQLDRWGLCSKISESHEQERGKR